MLNCIHQLVANSVCHLSKNKQEVYSGFLLNEYSCLLKQKTKVTSLHLTESIAMIDCIWSKSNFDLMIETFAYLLAFLASLRNQTEALNTILTYIHVLS